TFIDATFALVISLSLKIILNKRSKKFSNEIYNLESILIIFLSFIIVYFSIDLLISAVKITEPEELPVNLAIVTWVSGLLTFFIYLIERRYSWIEIVKTDIVHSKLDIISEILSGFVIIISNSALILIATFLIVIFLIFDVIKEVKEAIYAIIGVKVDSPLRDEIIEVLRSRGINVLNATFRRLGSFLSVNLVIALPSDSSIAKAYEIKKNVKRIIYNNFDNIVAIDFVFVPIKKSKVVSYGKSIKPLLSHTDA
ncbi:MAG: cation transporter, partial [Saccharolobus sp.]|uniref:cation transporter n=1 Tax=Saccharolobus sp. TaxID=2100761 RepID=UPI00317A7668